MVISQNIMTVDAVYSYSGLQGKLLNMGNLILFFVKKR